MNQGRECEGHRNEKHKNKTYAKRQNKKEDRQETKIRECINKEKTMNGKPKGTLTNWRKGEKELKKG